MSDEMTVRDGGEAPHFARATTPGQNPAGQDETQFRDGGAAPAHPAPTAEGAAGGAVHAR